MAPSAGRSHFVFQVSAILRIAWWSGISRVSLLNTAGTSGLVSLSAKTRAGVF